MPVVGLNMNSFARHRRKRTPRRRLHLPARLLSQGRFVSPARGKRTRHMPMTPAFEGIVKPREAATPDAGRVLEQEWLRKHRGDFSGRWVALAGDSLVSEGQTAKEVFAKARERGCDQALIVHVIEEPDLPFGGW